MKVCHIKQHESNVYAMSGVLVHKEQKKMWFFLNDRLNGEPLVGLPQAKLYPTVLMRDHNSLLKLTAMYPRVYQKAILDVIHKFSNY